MSFVDDIAVLSEREQDDLLSVLRAMSRSSAYWKVVMMKVQTCLGNI